MHLSSENNKIDIRRAAVTRYIVPLREGGSLPALAEADDGFRYVVKFRGAGHGTKALVSEFIGGEIARAAGMRVPELVLLDIDDDFGRTEPDEEIQDLLKASTGLNLGLHFLSGAFTWDVSVNRPDPLEASRIVWVDAFMTNVDRTVLNTNMLLWNHELWLIDHGASLYFHHSWQGWESKALSPFPFIKDHALLRDASRLDEIDREMHTRITPSLIADIVAAVPDQWLTDPEADRRVYRDFLTTRLENSRIFTDHAIKTRNDLYVR